MGAQGIDIERVVGEGHDQLVQVPQIHALQGLQGADRGRGSARDLRRKLRFEFLGLCEPLEANGGHPRTAQCRDQKRQHRGAGQLGMQTLAAGAANRCEQLAPAAGAGGQQEGAGQAHQHHQHGADASRRAPGIIQQEGAVQVFHPHEERYGFVRGEAGARQWIDKVCAGTAIQGKVHQHGAGGQTLDLLRAGVGLQHALGNLRHIGIAPRRYRGGHAFQSGTE